MSFFSISKKKGHQVFQKFSGFFGKIYSTELNPLYHLGDLSILFFIIACVTGIYIFVLYDIDPRHAWDSVEAMSANTFNGWMRTLHRYSSDLLIIFVLMHLLQALITGRFKRYISWISGIISFIVVILIGVTGYMLVWDQKAKLTGYLTAKFFSGLPLFDPAIAGAFLLNDLEIVGGFFKVALFGHIVFSLVTLIIIWIHVIPLSKPKIFPPKKLVYYTLIAIGIVSLVFPIKSDPPAQASFLPVETTFDWYYYFGYYLLKIFTINQNWIIMIGSGIFLSIFPFFIKRKKIEPVAIDLEICDACNLCSYDCPFEAIDMLMHNGSRKAILSPDKCTACGVCIGSCREHAITHPYFPKLNILEQPKTDVTIFSCSYFPEIELDGELTHTKYKVPCLGSVLAKDVQDMLANNTKSVAMLGCEDCYFRKGKTWSIDRFLRKRAPLFSKKYNASLVQFFTINSFSKEKLNLFVSKAKKNEPTNDIEVSDYKKPNHILSVLILTGFFLLMVPLSSTTVKFFKPQEKTLIVNFKFVSSPTSFDKNVYEGKHMQTLNPTVKSRSPVELNILESKTKKLLYKKQYEPRGLRKDIAMFIYTELILKEEAVDIIIKETAFPEKIKTLNNVQLKKGDGTIIILKDNQLAVAKI